MSRETQFVFSGGSITPTRRTALSIVGSTVISTGVYSTSAAAQSSNVYVEFEDTNSAGVIVFEMSDGFEPAPRRITGYVKGDGVKQLNETYLRIRKRGSSRQGETIPVEINSNNWFEVMWSTAQYTESGEFLCEFVADGTVIGEVEIQLNSSTDEDSDEKNTSDEQERKQKDTDTSKQLSVDFHQRSSTGQIIFESADGFEPSTKRITGEVSGYGSSNIKQVYLRIQRKSSVDSTDKVPVDINSNGEFKAVWDTAQYTESGEFLCEFVADGTVIGEVEIKLNLDANTESGGGNESEQEDNFVWEELTVDFDQRSSTGEIVFESDGEFEPSTKRISGEVSGRGVSKVQEVYLRIRKQGSSESGEKVPVDINSNGEFKAVWDTAQYTESGEFLCEFVANGGVIGEVNIVLQVSRENGVTYRRENSGGVVKIKRGSQVKISGELRHVTASESQIEIRKNGAVDLQEVDVSSTGRFSTVVDTTKYSGGNVELLFYHGDELIDSTKGVIVGGQKEKESTNYSESKSEQQREEAKEESKETERDRSEQRRGDSSQQSQGRGSNEQEGGRGNDPNGQPPRQRDSESTDTALQSILESISRWFAN